jgi:hypothetical protein
LERNDWFFYYFHFFNLNYLILFFKNINDIPEEECYEFAVIKSEKNDKTGKNFSLIRYKSLKDRMG